MGFSSIKGQDAALGFLRQALDRGRIPSAYLFLGAHHIGKRTTALALAKAMNCRQPPEGAVAGESCDQCPSCRKIDEQMHPDVETVSPDGQFIKIDQVRAIADKLSLIPFEARKRVVIVAQAERMNLQSANAFLKTLEEPPADTLLVLCVEDASRLPETIVSRCVPVRFGLLDDALVGELLGTGEDWDEGVRRFAVSLAKGTLRPALKDKAPQWLKIRESMIQLMLGLHKPVFPQAVEDFNRWAGSEDWAFVLEWLETWFRDAAVLRDGGPAFAGERLINADCLDRLQAFTELMSLQRMHFCYEQVLETRAAIRLWNANKALALESLWLGFRRAA